MDANFASWVFAPVEYDVDQPLLIDASTPERSLSFTQLRQKVRQLVAGLKAAGVGPGDCVCVNAFNDITYVVLYLGMMGAGAVFTGINPAYSTHEIVHHINMVSAKVIIVEPPMLEKTIAAAKSCGIPRSRIFAFDVHGPSQHADVQSWSAFFQHGESDFVDCHEPDTTVAAYHTTSGTSGLPKAAMIPHSYLIHQADCRISDVTVDYNVRRLTVLPPMHVFATPIVPASIRQGAPTYIMRRYDPAEFITAIATYQVTETWLAPPLVIAIPKSPLATETGLQSLRQIWFGGAGVTYENQLPFYALLHPDARINPVWGMTEAGWISTVSWPKKHTDNSVGSPLRGYRVRVVDDNNNVLPNPHDIGELQILAPSSMLGYLNNHTATKEAFTCDSELGDRWVNSGDIGYIDSENNIFIVDRKKDLIKVRGWQVSPAEVESRIQQHPSVVDVGVIGVARPNGDGESVRAYVVRDHNSTITGDELKKFATGTLARYKCPEDIIFTESIPRNPTGKILRRILREQEHAPAKTIEAAIDEAHAPAKAIEAVTSEVPASTYTSLTEGVPSSACTKVKVMMKKCLQSVSDFLRDLRKGNMRFIRRSRVALSVRKH